MDLDGTKTCTSKTLADSRLTASVVRTNKFDDPHVTASGAPRAQVPFGGYETLWFNTGTLCNITCHNCYIESSPRNDRLLYLTSSEVARFLDEADQLTARPREIGFTGGEPFMNPDIIGMFEDSLGRGFDVLILTNAMKPMQRHKAAIKRLHGQYPHQIRVRVSLDHYESEKHEQIRGPRSWLTAMEGLDWLSALGSNIAVACRIPPGETEAAVRAGFQLLFDERRFAIEATDPSQLILFPDLDEKADVPEITNRCWGILDKSPSDMMCASSRMVIRRKGDDRATVVACTLLPYAPDFEMGRGLADAGRAVRLNHRHCAKFCVLGGSTCSVSPDRVRS